jgi:hypothetical protein
MVAAFFAIVVGASSGMSMGLKRGGSKWAVVRKTVDLHVRTLTLTLTSQAIRQPASQPAH